MSSHEKATAPQPPRKPYRRPRLEKYGSIRDLTQIAGGTRGANDTFMSGNKTGL